MLFFREKRIPSVNSAERIAHSLSTDARDARRCATAPENAKRMIIFLGINKNAKR